MAENIAPFSGSKTEDVDAFLDACKNLHISEPFTSTEGKDKAILTTIIDNLHGNALSYFDALPTKTRKDSTKLAAALKERYESPGISKHFDVHTVLAPLLNLKQGDRKLADYAKEFEKAAEYLSPQEMLQIMGSGRFIASLSDEVAQKHLHLMQMMIIECGKWPTVEMMVEAAIKWDETTYKKETEDIMEKADELLWKAPRKVTTVDVHGNIVSQEDHPGHT